MKKISKVNAFSEISKEIQKNNYNKANEMYKIVSETIASDKEKKIFSEFIELKSKKEEQLFENILICDDEVGLKKKQLI